MLRSFVCVVALLASGLVSATAGHDASQPHGAVSKDKVNAEQAELRRTEEAASTEKTGKEEVAVSETTKSDEHKEQNEEKAAAKKEEAEDKQEEKDEKEEKKEVKETTETTTSVTTTTVTTVTTTTVTTTTGTTTETTTTTTVTTTTTTTARCWEKDMAWEPMIMNGTKPAEGLLPHECQAECQAQVGCSHFTVLKLTPGEETGVCFLQDQYAVRTEHIGAVSGPFQCWSVLTDDDEFEKVEKQTYVAHTEACLEIGGSWAPAMMHEDKAKGIMGQFLAADSHEELIEACREYCAETEGCAHFTINLDTRLCTLAGKDATRADGVEHVVSGPPSHCLTEVVTAKKFLATRKVAEKGHGISIIALAACVAAAAGLAVFQASRRKRSISRLVTAYSELEAGEDAAQVIAASNGGLE